MCLVQKSEARRFHRNVGGKHEYNLAIKSEMAFSVKENVECEILEFKVRTSSEKVQAFQNQKITAAGGRGDRSEPGWGIVRCLRDCNSLPWDVYFLRSHRRRRD